MLHQLMYEARFAAKEAALKAVSARRLSWYDITICDERLIQSATEECSGSMKGSGLDESSNKPYAVVHTCREMPPVREGPNSENLEPSVGFDIKGGGGRSGEAKTGWELEGQIAELSISHDGDYATAVVLAVNNSSGGWGNSV